MVRGNTLFRDCREWTTFQGNPIDPPDRLDGVTYRHSPPIVEGISGYQIVKEQTIYDTAILFGMGDTIGLIPIRGVSVYQ